MRISMNQLRSLAVAVLVAVALQGTSARAEEETFDDTLLGDFFGLRPALSEYGLGFSLDYTAEVFANLDGGRSRGATYQGLAEIGVEADTPTAPICSFIRRPVTRSLFPTTRRCGPWRVPLYSLGSSSTRE